VDRGLWRLSGVSRPYPMLAKSDLEIGLEALTRHWR
jgi:hypothetical protein